MLHLNRLSLLFLCLAAVYISCSNAPQKTETEEAPVLKLVSTDPSVIDQLIVDFLQDSTLRYEGAFPPMDTALLEYQRIQNAAGLQKVYKYFRDIHGTCEQQFFWDTNSQAIQFIEEKRVRKACPKLDQNCLTWQRSYFSEGQLAMVKVFRDTVPDGTYPSFDHGEPLPIDDIASYRDTLLASFRAIQTEADTINWKKGVPIQGEYLYYADASHFVDCQDGKSYDVASSFLESAYVELSSGEIEPAIIEATGYYTPLPNMENIMRQHLVVLYLLEMRPGEKCP